MKERGKWRTRDGGRVNHCLEWLKVESSVKKAKAKAKAKTKKKKPREVEEAKERQGEARDSGGGGSRRDGGE